MNSKPKKKKLFSKIISGITVGIFVLLVGLQVLGQVTAKNNFGIPHYGDYQVLVVLTDSMEPTYKVGTGIFVKKVNDLSTLRPSSDPLACDGDVITFYRPSDQLIITHRVIEVIDNGDGTYDFKALGDNLNAQTCGTGGCTIANADYVEGKNVLGKVTGQSMAFGKTYAAVSNPFVILIFAIVPLFFVFFSSVVDLVKQLKTSDGPVEHEVINDDFERIKEQEKLRILIELEKEKMRNEIKEQMKGDKENE